MQLCRVFAPLMATSLMFLAGCGGGGGGSTPTPPAVQPPTGLTYTVAAPTYTKGTAITANTPTSGGGAVVSYSVSPTLPAGLALSTTTGSITGTPTEVAASTAYVVTATNTGGSAPATLTLTVKDVAPTNLTYTDSAPTYLQGSTITANTPTNGGGAVVSYSVSPTLPAGLVLGATTGSITGTPTTVTASASYVVTATNSGGDATATVTIRVNAAPSITTQPTSQTKVAGQSATFTVVASGTPTPTYQWQRSNNTGTTWANVSAGTGGATASYSTAATTTADSGAQFRAVATNSAGSANSNAATLTVTAAPALAVALPAQQLLQVTQDGTLTPTVSGGVPPYTYAWTKGGAVLSGVTASHSLPSLRLSDQGVYRVAVTDALGASTAADSKLFVATTGNLPAGLNPVSLAVSGDDIYLTSPGQNLVVKLRASAAAPQIIEVPGGPTGLAVDAAGNPWVTLKTSGQIARINKTTAVVTTFEVGSQPHGIALGLTGELWFTLQGTSQIGMLASSGGTPTLYNLSAKAGPAGIHVAADGTVWFTEREVGKVGRLAPGAAQVEEWACTNDQARPDQILATTDGQVYYTDSAAAAAVMFPAATQSAGRALTHAFAFGLAPQGGPAGLAQDADGYVWLTQQKVGKVTRLARDGSTYSYSLPSSQSQPTGIAVVSQPSSTLRDLSSREAGTSTPASGVVVYAALTGSNQVAQIPAAPQTLTVAINATEPKRMLKAGLQTFTATVTGATNTAVTWELVEGTSAGTITQGGVFTASTTPGTYHVIARSVEDPSKFGRLELVIYPWTTWPQGQIGALAGNLNGIGNVDGLGQAARFNRPTGVAVDAAGNTYVVDSENLIIRKITPAGLTSTFAGSPGQSGFLDGLGQAARFSAPGGIAIDVAGNLYVTDRSTLRKISPAGAVTTLAGTTDFGSTDGLGTIARFRQLSSVAVDAAGNVYVTDWVFHTVRKITAAGLVTTLAGLAEQPGSADGTGSAARFSWPQGIGVDAEGNVYVADAGNFTVRKITPAGLVTTLAGMAGSSGSTEGLGDVARFSNLAGLALDAVGTIYVSAGGIRKITPAGLVSTLAGGTWGSADGQGSAAAFNGSQGLAVDTDGNVYVADNLNYTIRKITPTGLVSTLAGRAGKSGSTDGLGSAAAFYSPLGVAVDAAGNTYVADTGSSAIRKITPGGLVSTLAGGSSASFDQPQGLALDGAGNVYVADTRNHTIRKITPAGQVSTLAGSTGLKGSADGQGSTARFNAPAAVAVDADGNVYVADDQNATIRKITSSGLVSTLAGSVGLYGSTDGQGSTARFGRPNGVAVDATGHVYVSDYWTAAIRKITPGGLVSTLAGDPWQGGSADGLGSAAGFNHATGLAVDGSGNLYVADRDNNAIRMLTPAGFVGTILGDANSGINRSGSVRDGVDLPLPTAYGALAAPTAVAVGADGTLYITTSNGVMTTGAVTTLVAPSSLTYTPSTLSYTKSVAITALTPTHAGGAVELYSVTPALPTGLLLNASTGVISGTPTAITAVGDYTITAANLAGSTTATLTITVNEATPTGLTYTLNTAVYTKDVAITANTPSSTGGAVVSYAVSPTLPAGLLLSATTGVISGTPTVVAASASYVVTATNTGGSVPVTLSITIVVAPIASNFTTSTATPAYGTTFTLTPTYTGGVGSIDPTVTCPVSGSPSAAITADWFGAKVYTLLVTNAAGASDSHLTVSVTPHVASVGAISPAAPTLNVGASQDFTSTVTGGLTNAVTWSSGGAGTGTWSSNTWTAPNTPGSYTITATSTEDGTTHATTTATVVEVISGTLSAPAGSIATIRSPQGSSSEAFLASPIPAASTSLPPMGAGITVNLIEINSDGTQKALISTCVTAADGSYSLSAPANFVPGPSYVVRAVVPTVGSIEGYTISNFVTSTTANIDPYTQASVALITASLTAGGANITTLGSASVLAIQGTVYSNMGNVPNTATTTSAMLAALSTAMTQDEESKNTVTNLAAPFGITGTVKNLAGEPLAGIGIGACSFGGLTLMGVTHTAADGTYTVHVPTGDYVIGAMNMTTTSFAASGWWTSTGPVSSQFKAGKVTVSDALITKDFTLIAGGRLSGGLMGVATPTDVPLPGMQVALCDFASGQTLTSASTGPDGKFVFNVAPGEYYVSVRNKTRYMPYGSANYNGAATGGGKNMTQASKVSVTANATLTGNMVLTTGHQISGTVKTDSDANSGVAVVGMPVRFQDAGAGNAGAESTRTDVDGQYRLWVQPGNYNVLCRGQQATNLNASAADVVQDFKAPVGKVTMKLVDSSTSPISQAQGNLYYWNSTTPSLTGLGQEISNSEGMLELYTTGTLPANTTLKLGFSIYTNELFGSSTLGWDGTKYTAGGGNPIKNSREVPFPVAGATTPLGSIALPAGVILRGFVLNSSTNQGRPNVTVQIRKGGSTDGSFQMVNVRTKSDGSYTVTLPTGMVITQIVANPTNGGANWSWSTGGSNPAPPAIGATGSGPVELTISY